MSDSTTPASPSPEPAVTEPAAETEAGATATPSTAAPDSAGDGAAGATAAAEPERPGASVRRVSGDGVTTATGPAERADGAGRHSRLVFRVSPIAWLFVLFLLFCITPAAAGPFRPLLVLYVIPVVLGWWIARTRTVAEPTGLVARTVFSRTRIEWDDLRGLKLDGRKVHAVLAGDRTVQLPELRPRHLGLVSDISGGRIPDPTKTTAPEAEAESESAKSTEAESAPSKSSAAKSDAAESTADGGAASAAGGSGAAEDTPDGGSTAESSE